MNDFDDPWADRVVKTVPPLARYPISRDDLWKQASGKKGELPNVENLRKHLLAEGAVRKQELIELILEATKILRREPNVIRIKEPVIIVGDIHGQYYDLIHMFEKVVDSRDLSKTKLLFLGDYVDRGNYSIEVCIFLYCLKINYPGNIILLRGNHESRAMTEHFTFREEVLRKYDGDESVYEAFIESFESMPLSADVNGDYLCMHGGISPQLKVIEDINKIDRFIEPPLTGFLCDLLWSDPVGDKEARSSKFLKNVERECSYKFGLDPIKQVLKKNNLLSVIRAHQVQIDGYKMHRWGGSSAFPSVITVFSAPNYCGSYKNKGAVILIENERMNIKQYKEVDQPFHLPENMNLFTWSFPFLVDKIAEILQYVIIKNTIVTKGEIEKMYKQGEKDFDNMIQSLINDQVDEDEKHINAIKAKVISIGRMSQMMKARSTEGKAANERKLSEGNSTSDGRINKEVLRKTMEGEDDEGGLFVNVKDADSNNEKFPIVQFNRRESIKLGITPEELRKLQMMDEQNKLNEANTK